MREWIYKALFEVIVNGSYSNLYLKNHLNEVEPKDRALATNIFYGSIQNYNYCEYVWKQYAKSKVDKKVSIILTMSVYQLLFLNRIPDYAIINEGVNLVKKYKKNATGFANAILHKINKDTIQLPDDEMERMSILYSIPKWLLQMWKAQYGSEKMEQMAKCSNQTMPVTVRWNPNYTFENSEDLIKAGKLYEFLGNDISNHPLYLEGKMSTQDLGSYLICEYMDVKPGMTVLDTCAAPGTKSMALAEMMHNQGRIDSIDLHEHRVKLIENDAKRLHIDIVHPICHDSCDLSSFDTYDRVLCDVPCSGYGVLSRKPDIKLSMASNDMDTLIPLQKKILESASKHVKKDGILVYSTCTVNKKENEKQVDAFLKDNSNFIKLEEQTIFPDIKQDGFYMCKMKCVK